jgi:glycosyltransferase involved in cell wall biosynthesis
VRIAFLVGRWKQNSGGAEVAMVRLAKALQVFGHEVVFCHLGSRRERSWGAINKWKPRAKFDAVICAAGMPDEHVTGAYKVVRAVHSRITPQWALGEPSRTDGVIWASRALSKPVEVPSVVSWPIVDPHAIRVTPGEMVTLVNPIPEKGGELILEVARMLPRIPFLFVQGGWWTKRQVGQDGAPKNVEWMTYQTDSRRIYEQTRVLLYPGPWDSGEGWMHGVGMTALEASCSGIPVIASPGPGLLESMGGFAKFVESHKPEYWAEAIEQVHGEDWDRYHLRALERARTLSPYDEAQTVAELLEGL